SVIGPAKDDATFRIVNLLAGGSLGPGQPLAVESERPLPVLTSFWARSSANGRYMGFSQWVVDLERWEAHSKGAMIQITAPFDPVFTPDNRSMSWAGVLTDDPACSLAPGCIVVCQQSALEATGQNAIPEFDFFDDSC